MGDFVETGGIEEEWDRFASTRKDKLFRSNLMLSLLRRTSGYGLNPKIS
jgi:hypothetical protein